jgi:2-amino-4-hydroxy-6-hydroxymethyldihydropteridine diphosphokinase
VVEGIFLGLGSNLGDRKALLTDAIARLEAAGVEIRSKSSIYETPPWGKQDQPAFLNMVIQVAFEGSPEDLLAIILQVEEAMGRLRTEHWGPRIIDIDILAFGNQHFTSQRLTIPHPMLSQRAFVLVPWSEIAPAFPVAGHDITVWELLIRLPETDLKTIHKYPAD